MNEAPTRRQLPTHEELRIWRDYIETSEALRSRLASRMQEGSGLSAGDYQVLLALNEAENHQLRSSELAHTIGWERSRLSHHLGRMEKRGLICREECASDSRGAYVRLIDEGAEAFRCASIPHLRAVREAFIDAFTPEELSLIDNLTTTLRGHLGLSSRM